MPANPDEFRQFIADAITGDDEPPLPKPRPAPRTGRAAQRKISEGNDTSLIAMLLWMFGGLEVLGGIAYAYQVGLPLGALLWIPFLAGACVTWGFALVIQLMIEIRDELRKRP